MTVVNITAKEFESTKVDGIIARGSFMDGDGKAAKVPADTQASPRLTPRFFDNNKKVFWVATKLGAEISTGKVPAGKTWCIRYSWDEDYEGSYIVEYGDKMNKSDASKLVKVPKSLWGEYWG